MNDAFKRKKNIKKLFPMPTFVPQEVAITSEPELAKHADIFYTSYWWHCLKIVLTGTWLATEVVNIMKYVESRIAGNLWTWLRFTWQPAGGWRPAQRAQLKYQVYLVLWNACTNLNWQLLQSDSRRLHHLDHILNYSAEFSFQSFYLLLSNILLFSFFSGHIDFL